MAAYLDIYSGGGTGLETTWDIGVPTKQSGSVGIEADIRLWSARRSGLQSLDGLERQDSQ